jgi:anti-sigma-K factor RskA
VIYDDAQDALAAEYVLGTLSGDEREHAEALLEIDPGFAESVRLWERRLGELNVMVEAVEPPAAVWEKISKEIGYVAPASTNSTVPMEAAAAIPPADAPGLLTDEVVMPPFAEREKEEQPATILPAEQLPDAVSDSITASLAKSLAEPPAEEAAAPLSPPQEKIERTANVERSANVVQLSRRVQQWRSTAIAMQAIAALLAIYVAAAQFYPGLIPLRARQSEPQIAQAPGQLAARLVAVLQQDPTAPAFLLSVDPLSRTLVVRRVSATPEQGRSYELWLIAKGAPAPKSLGLVGSEEFTERTLPGNFDLATLRAASYAVSLEPAGGSPSGVPTGPVLFTGNIVESVPTSPRT